MTFFLFCMHQMKDDILKWQKVTFCVICNEYWEQHVCITWMFVASDRCWLHIPWSQCEVTELFYSLWNLSCMPWLGPWDSGLNKYSCLHDMDVSEKISLQKVIWSEHDHKRPVPTVIVRAAGTWWSTGNGAEKRPAASANIGRALLHTRAMIALASAPRAALATLVQDETSCLGLIGTTSPPPYL